VCVAASAGWCLAAGAAVFVANNYRKLFRGEEWDAQMYSDAAFTVTGFGAAGALGRAVNGAWRGAFTSSAIARSPSGGVEAARTYANMSTNGKMALTSCGVGGFSPSYCTR
jgi:hypothetical protein